MKTKNYTKEYLLWIIKELREEIKQCKSGVSWAKFMIEEEKKRLMNTKLPHNDLWNLRFKLSRFESTLKEDKKELRKYEVEYNRRFNPSQPSPLKRRLIYYDRESWRKRGKSDLEVLQFYLDKVKENDIMIYESTVGYTLQMYYGMNKSWPSGIRKYLKEWPENTKVRLYYGQGESGYYVIDNYYLIEICDTE